MKKKLETKFKPDYVFEVSWEVCNKIGGIYTVVSTKAPLMQKAFGDHFIMVGPDLYKGAEGNVEFLEDTELFKEWREKFTVDGLKLRIGRWDIPSKPIALLIDFSPLFAKKDEIFSELWEYNRLDSISGGWNYTEPALFGYAVGKAIADFKAFYVQPNEQIIAHFHEWMTGSGVLYLKNTVPEVATVFTTHATVTGRSICANGLPFYSKFDTYKGDQVAKDLNIEAMHSLEKTAAITADAFTTVSDNTAKECAQLLGKAVDKVATNGFDDSFVPDANVFDEKRKVAREKLVQVASAVMGYQAKEDSLLIATSGRYEYKNKGLDLFIDALAGLNLKTDLGREVIAFIMVPAAHTLPKPEVLEGLKSGLLKKGEEPSGVTHYLQDPAHDPIWQQVISVHLQNAVDHKVKLIFVPTYLDGRDGVFDMSYYDLLIGLDLTAFPSYYEPFGYTPLESLAFHIPTITTTLTGFGIQVKSSEKDFEEGMLVLERDDFNDDTVTDQMTNYIFEFSTKSEQEVLRARKKAFEISRAFLWENLIENYNQVYRVGSERHILRKSSFERLMQSAPVPFAKLEESNDPIWKKAMAKFKLPDTLKDLERLAKNLWWTWHHEAVDLFSSIDIELWEAVRHNPLALLNALQYDQFLELEKNKAFMTNLKSTIKKFDVYMEGGSKKLAPKVAYLCMEYGLHESFPMYSGGLGILAGDYLKEASDKNVDIVAFGLLYRHGYFSQSFNLHGEQISKEENLHFTQLPILPVLDNNGSRLMLQLPLRGPMLNAQVWKVDVGRTPLYLFDTDIPENSDENKNITHQLYGGDNENRFRQELVLAANTVQLMQHLQISPDLYHYNEGHTAFAGLVRIIQLVVGENLNFDEAAQYVRASTLFTTHTPVPAGQDAFNEDLLRSYQSHFAETLNVPWNQLLGFGRINAQDRSEKFSMSYLAARFSSEINTVSKIHADVTRKMFQPLWKGVLEDELQIQNVTNGVHYQSWTAQGWQQLFLETFGPEFLQDQSNATHWAKIKNVPSEKIHAIKKDLKKEMIEGIRNRMKAQLKAQPARFGKVHETLSGLNDNDLIVGFARRFATYKRADLLFKDTKRLSKIVNDPKRPIKFIFAGKAHPADKAGQDLIRRIIELSETPEFSGKLLFVPNYDMALARLMVQGTDIWLNTPERGREASGTSGMKAVLNGTLNFSVMDGWWAEGYKENAGWALSQERDFDNQEDQNDLDANMIYDILENEIIPEFYGVNASGISETWTNRIKNSIAQIAPRFTMARMMDEYIENYYNKMHHRSIMFREKHFENTKVHVEWIKKIYREWDKISVVNVQVSNGTKPLNMGDPFKAEVTLNLNGIPASDIGVELVFASRSEDDNIKIRKVEELPLASEKSHRATYKGKIMVSFSGSFQYGIRYFPKSKWLLHRRDLPLVKWI